MFLCISIVKETDMVQFGISTKRSLNSCCLKGMQGENDVNFLSLYFFLVPQKDETFLRHHKEV